MNEYNIIDSSMAELIIYSPKYGRYVCLVDTEDMEKLKKYKWCVNFDKSINGFYIVAASVKNNKKTLVRIHRAIMDYNGNLQVDHINHNTFDNRKQNLRIVTNQQNCINKKELNKTNKSGYRGVVWDKIRKKWKAQIQYKNKTIFLGYFKDIKSASDIYEKARLKYFNPIMERI